MAQLDQTYETEALPKSSFDPIPAKRYSSVIHSASVENTKNNGQMLKLRFDITGPDHQGRVVFGTVTLKNANPKAVEIGKQQLGDLLRATGIPRLTDSDQLIGCPCDIQVGIEKSEEYGDRNKINGYRPPAGSSPMPTFGNVSQGSLEAKGVTLGGIPAGLKSGGAKPGWAAPKE
jgi:hypothetical protein